VLVAYNVWLRGCSLQETRAIASRVRAPGIRTLGLQVGGLTQVSMNLVDPAVAGPREAFDSVRQECEGTGATVEGAELVGLVPREVLSSIPRGRWEELDLSEDRTIEARISALGISR
jgi:glutamate formiminotransferase